MLLVKVGPDPAQGFLEFSPGSGQNGHDQSALIFTARDQLYTYNHILKQVLSFVRI
jgi:hypothetical protein